jgi:hypothetical protein
VDVNQRREQAAIVATEVGEDRRIMFQPRYLPTTPSISTSLSARVGCGPHARGRFPANSVCSPSSIRQNHARIRSSRSRVLSPPSERFIPLGIVQPVELDVTQKNLHIGSRSYRFWLSACRLAWQLHRIMAESVRLSAP